MGKQTWILGTGRRKESVARVFLRAGSGKFKINGRTAEEYFPNVAWKHNATEPLKFTSLHDQVDVVITAKGGGVGGQAGAVRMGLARAISVFNAELRPALRKNGFLTRDSRMKERKKYGQKVRSFELRRFRASELPRSRPARSRQKGCSSRERFARERKQQSLKEETWQ
jgi:small subunit ribosomal protein S9